MNSKIVIICILIVLIILAGCTKTDNNNIENKTKAVSNEREATQSKVVDTYQDKCYDSLNQINCPDKNEPFFGQDSQYLGNSPTYIDNGDGTITDLNTGLMWIKSAGTKKYYYDSSKSTYFASYSDWRIPNIKELYSLMDFRGTDPSSNNANENNLKPFINTDYFDFLYGNTSNGDRIIDSQWITTNIYESTVMGGQECFFGVNFADGRIKCYPTMSGHNNGYYLRYVRGPIYGENEFIDNKDGTITDDSSRLMWQKEDSKKGLKWEEALNYCETLELAGFIDWRLPNAKELQYILDYSRSPDTTQSPAISSLFETSRITNEAGQKDYPYFWTSTTHLNHENSNSAVYISFGRALGYMNGKWMDVHGAGAQRSDPKEGNPEDYPTGFGPQGDARRIYNYARCVRGGAELVQANSSFEAARDSSQNILPVETNQEKGMPPQEAINACNSKSEQASCSFSTPHGTISGTCMNIQNFIACIPQ